MLTLLLRGVSGSLDGVDIFWTPMLLMGASGSLGVNTFDSADIPCWSMLPLLMLTRFLIFMISEEEDIDAGAPGHHRPPRLQVAHLSQGGKSTPPTLKGGSLRLSSSGRAPPTSVIFWIRSQRGGAQSPRRLTLDPLDGRPL